MYEAIDHSVDGEIKEGRLVPSYSNIALMYGFLWDFAAVHDKRDDWKKQSTDWTESVYSLFKKYDAFFEYNSPTYYGVDLAPASAIEGHHDWPVLEQLLEAHRRAMRVHQDEVAHAITWFQGTGGLSAMDKRLRGPVYNCELVRRDHPIAIVIARLVQLARRLQYLSCHRTPFLGCVVS